MRIDKVEEKNNHYDLYFRIFRWYFQFLIWKILFGIGLIMLAVGTVGLMICPLSRPFFISALVVLCLVFFIIVLLLGNDSDEEGKRRYRKRKWILLRSMTGPEIRIARRNKRLATVSLRAFSFCFLLSIFIDVYFANQYQSELLSGYIIVGFLPAMGLFFFSWKNTKLLNFLFFPLVIPLFLVIRIYMFLLDLFSELMKYIFNGLFRRRNR